MWARAVILASVAGCYAPHAVPGSACTPDVGCPAPETCALVGGSYVCVEGRPPDASTIDGPAHDAALADASHDAPVPRWALVQTKAAGSGTVTITASGTGHLIVVAVESTATGQVVGVTDNVNNTYVAVPNARATNATAGNGVELWYVASSKSGATAIAAVAPSVAAMSIWEVSGISTTNPIDTATTLDDQATSTTPDGAPITTAAAGDFVVSVVIVDHIISSIQAGSAFTADHFTNGNGWSHLTDPTAPAGSYQSHWIQPASGVSCATSAAFRRAP